MLVSSVRPVTKGPAQKANQNRHAEEMARRNTADEPADDELEKAKQGMRNYLRKAATRELNAYARKEGAQWVFEDRQKDSSAA